MKGNKNMRASVSIPLAQAFYEHLKARGVGREHAITSRELAATYAKGTPDARRLFRRLANVCTRMGLPVCSGDDGYWVAAGWDDINRTISRLASEREAIDQRIAAYRKMGTKAFGAPPEFHPPTATERAQHHGQALVQALLPLDSE